MAKTSLSSGSLIRKLLLESPQVRAITERVFPVVTDKATLPFIVYRRSSLIYDPVKNNPGTDTITIDLLCFAGSYAQSLDLAEAVREALDGARLNYDGLTMRTIFLTGGFESWEDDAFVQGLSFNARVS